MLAPPATSVPELLSSNSTLTGRGRTRDDTAALVDILLERRRQFGITRVGSITRLDRVGVPVVQVTRPLALSNAVTQGKGFHLVDAAASALMETLETWAAENIPMERAPALPIASQSQEIQALFAGCVVDEPLASWEYIPLRWLEGWDLFTGAKIPVPAAMVDTIYTLPSPHPFVFPRTTTGLAAAGTFAEAALHAGLELLEREAVARAQRTAHFFDRWQIDVLTVGNGLSAKILKRIAHAKLLAGIWRVPANHEFPIYWCHLMESDAEHEMAPLPAEGFGCDFTHDGALAKALLEACQARLTAISGAREDITRQSYPRGYDREHLSEWRRQLVSPGRPARFPVDAHDKPCGPAALDNVLRALGAAGAQAAILVPLFIDELAEINVVRMVAPPLRHGRHH